MLVGAQAAVSCTPKAAGRPGSPEGATGAGPQRNRDRGANHPEISQPVSLAKRGITLLVPEALFIPTTRGGLRLVDLDTVFGQQPLHAFGPLVVLLAR